MAKKAMTFEESLDRAEEILERLEAGNESLDTTLKLYEEGIALVRSCNEQLETAEQKIKMLRIQPDGTAAAVDFETEGDAER